MTRTTPIRSMLVLAACGLLALTGCGVGAGEDSQGVSLDVTRDFGERSVLTTDTPETKGEDTVMRLLQRNAKVETRYGGGFVQAIDGNAGSTNGSADWMYYVNGIEAPKGAASTELHDGDRVWWDLHTWKATQRIPAVVGSFPAPFLHGEDGKRWPVLIECAELDSAQCDTVSKSLSEEGVVAARNRIGSSFTQHTVRILVGPWEAVRGDRTVRRMEQGPAASGVFAEPTPDGKTITVLHGDGSVSRELGAGTGLIAATAATDQPPIWVVTGTDDAGITAAAAALDEATLRNHFAYATTGGRGVRIPEPGP